MAIPIINSITPNVVAIGKTIIIRGNNFGNKDPFQEILGKEPGKVKVGGADAQISHWSNNSISAVVPDPSPGNYSAGTQTVVVEAPGGNSAPENITIILNITGVKPSSFARGNTVKISGTNFNTTQGTQKLLLADIEIDPTSSVGNTQWSNTEITFRFAQDVPAQSTLITLNDGTNLATFPVHVTPYISGISPSSGGIETIVTLTGNTFGDSGVVYFNNVAALAQSWSGGAIETTIPKEVAIGRVRVAVEAGGIKSNIVDFTLTPSSTASTQWVSKTVKDISGLAPLFEQVKKLSEGINKNFQALFKVIELLLTLLKTAKALITAAVDALNAAIQTIKRLLTILKNELIKLINDYLGMGLYLFTPINAKYLRQGLRDILLSPYVWDGTRNVPASLATDSTEPKQNIRVPDPDVPGSYKIVRQVKRRRRKLNFDAFKQDLINSFADAGDKFRPTFSPDIKTSGVIALVANDNLFMFYRMIIALTYLFSGGNEDVTANMTRWLTGIVLDEYNKSISQQLNIPKEVYQNCLSFINDANSGIQGILASLKTTAALQSASPSVIDFDSLSVSGEVGENILVLSALTSGPVEPLLQFAIAPFKSLELGGRVDSNQADIFGIGDNRSNRAVINVTVKEGSNRYKLYVNKFLGTSHVWDPNNPNFTDKLNFNKENTLGLYLGAGPATYSITVGLENSGQAFNYNDFLDLAGVFKGPMTSDIEASESGTTVNAVYFNTQNYAYRIFKNGVWQPLNEPNTFVFSLWDDEAKTVKQKMTVVIPRLAYFDESPGPSKPGYTYDDNYKAAVQLTLKAPSGEISDFLRSVPALNKNNFAYLPMTISSGASENDISTWTKYSRRFDIELLYTITAVNMDYPKLKFVLNGKEITPSKYQLGLPTSSFDFNSVTFAEGRNILEIFSESTKVATPIIDYDPAVNLTEDNFEEADITSYSSVFRTAIVTATAESKVGLAPRITSLSEVQATASFGINYTQGASFVDNFGGVGTFMEEGRNSSNSQYKPPAPTAIYSLYGEKQANQGIVYVHYDINRKKFSIILGTAPDSSLTWSAGSLNLGVGDHQFWVMSYIQPSSFRVSGAASKFKSKYTSIPDGNFVFDDSIKDVIRRELSVGDYTPGGGENYLSKEMTFTLKVNPPKAARASTPPDWISFSLKNIFNVVDPLDALLTGLIDNYLPSSADALSVIGDWIEFFEEKIANFRAMIQEILDIINLLLSLLNIGGTGFWFLGINKAPGTDGFIYRINTVATPPELAKAQFVTGFVLLLPSDAGGDLLMTKTFAHLPSSPLPGEDKVKVKYIDDTYRQSLSVASAALDSENNSMLNSKTGDPARLKSQLADTNKVLKEF